MLKMARIGIPYAPHLVDRSKSPVARLTANCSTISRRIKISSQSGIRFPDDRVI